MILKEQSLYDQFQEAFYLYYDPLCQYAYNLVKEKHACEDIVQEIFLRIWEKKQELIGTVELRFYLYTAVRNNSLTHIEKSRKLMITELSGEEQATAPPEPDRHQQHPVRDYNSLLEDALAQLPVKCREVFVLSRISKLTYQQIADTLDISIKTVENQMSKALRILRGFIRDRQVHIISFMLFLYSISALLP